MKMTTTIQVRETRTLTIEVSYSVGTEEKDVLAALDDLPNEAPLEIHSIPGLWLEGRLHAKHNSGGMMREREIGKYEVTGTKVEERKRILPA